VTISALIGEFVASGPGVLLALGESGTPTFVGQIGFVD